MCCFSLLAPNVKKSAIEKTVLLVISDEKEKG